MKHIIAKTLALSLPLSLGLATAIAVPATIAQAQSSLNGTYVNDDDSAKWVFGNGTGQFYQYKSINGNPGTIVTDFRYSIVNGGKTLNYTQTAIRLENHPMGPRSQKLDKASTENIEIRPNAIVIGGKIYTRQ